LVELAKEYGATDLRVFGSVAQGRARRGSDVDLLVRFEHPIGLLAKVEFQERASRLLGRPVDLTTPAMVHWLIRPSVLDEAVPV
jgi:predicted nucleotidyltransferase